MLRKRVTAATATARSKGQAVAEVAKQWRERQDPVSPAGFALRWFERYRESDGQLYAVLVAAYLFVTLFPAGLAVATYAGNDPQVLAERLIDRLELNGVTATFTRDVLVGAAGHQLTATLVAVGSVVVFGSGMARALQLVYARAWRMPARGLALVDRLRYVCWLLVFMALVVGDVLLLLWLASTPSWVEWALAPVVAAIAVVFLTWTPTFLLHHRLSARDALPGALLAVLGFAAMRGISTLLFARWLNWYSTYFGGLGIVMAIFFWLLLGTTILVATAAMAPPYVERRRARRLRA